MWRLNGLYHEINDFWKDIGILKNQDNLFITHGKTIGYALINILDHKLYVPFILL